MAQRRFEISLTLVLLTMMWSQPWAQPNCTPVIASLSPCLGFITGNLSTPSSSCCSQLASVVQTQSQCLCTVLTGMPQLPLPFVVNQTQALTLPGACNIQTPPVSQCNVASGAAPAPSPAPASPETPTVPTAPPTSTPSVPSGTSPKTPAVPSGTSPKTPATPSVPSVPSAKGGSKTTGVSSSATSTKFAPLLVFFLATTSVFSLF